jgi:Pyruvate/2-oxoacid:ferredoxin oxidoreductase delta subunit/DNA-binding Lrp family transcriptional regulator
MTTGNQVYLDVLKKWGAPTSKRIINILEATFSPEEGTILLQLFAPATCQEVASRLNADEKKVLTILEELADRGVITKGQTQYCFHLSLIAFHHHVFGGIAREPVPEKIERLWGDFFFNEWCDMFVEGYIQRQQATGWPVHRVWPLTGALELSPNIKPEQIIPEENFKLKLENTKRIIVGHCGCRKNWSVCDHPVETCFAPLQGSAGEFFIKLPNRTSIREISLEEAMDVVRRNEEAGLVNTGACFCCTCSCEILYSLKRANRFDLLGRSRYQATVDEEKCTGCQDCVERCPFDAIEMKKPANSKKLKASIINEKCMGCGVCIVGCEQRALTYELVRPPEYIRRPQSEPSQVGVMCRCTEVK